MHVLVVPSWYPTTEAPQQGIYFAEQIRLLRDEGLKMGVIYPEQQSLRYLSWNALRQKHFQTTWTTDHGVPTLRRYGWNIWWRFPPGMRWRVRSAVRLAHRYADRHGVPDIVHAHSARWAGAAAAQFSDAFGVPYVLTEHYSGFVRDELFPWRWSLFETGIRQAHGLAAVSSVLKDALVEKGLADPEDIEIQPNPVRASLFTLPPDERPAPPPFRFVTVAALNPRKNVEGLLQAFANAFEHLAVSTVSLTIVGGGPRREPLEATARRLGIDDRVAFRGQLNRQAVRDALWDAHAFVLPSRYETFGVALVEAMATGLPVVATRCGGPEDIVTEETGRLVPATDPDALAEALRTMRTDWTAYDPDHIREHVLDRYGPEPFVQRTRSFYRRVGAV